MTKTFRPRRLLAPLALALALTPGLLTPGAKAAPANAVPQTMNQVFLTFAPIVKKVSPAVVNVYARSVVQAPSNPLFADPLFQQFFGVSPQMRQRVQQSLGSGVIVRGDGLILTNNHVIAGAQDIVVALADKREFKAKVLLSDARTDLAVLRIDTHGEHLPTIDFADSDKLNVGDLVLAIGDPFGVGQTVTMGIVSALARTQMGASDYQFFIQTDAAINPGNSGGALVTTDGKLAGINTAIYSRTGGSVGIGFAIPANLARRVVEGVQSGGHGVELAWVGAEGQPVTGDIAATLGLPRPEGVLLRSVYPGGPVSKAGLHQGDVVLAVDGVEVDDMQSLNYRIATHRPGDVVKLHVAAGKKISDVSVALALPPETPPRELQTVGGRNPLTGAKIENLSPAVATDLQMGLLEKGVVIVSVAEGSPSGGYGFQPGDIVRSVNGVSISRVGDLVRALSDANGHWDLIIDRSGQRLTLSVNG
jgi:serine protease Do